MHLKCLRHMAFFCCQIESSIKRSSWFCLGGATAPRLPMASCLVCCDVSKNVCIYFIYETGYQILPDLQKLGQYCIAIKCRSASLSIYVAQLRWWHCRFPCMENPSNLCLIITVFQKLDYNNFFGCACVSSVCMYSNLPVSLILMFSIVPHTIGHSR